MSTVYQITLAGELSPLKCGPDEVANLTKKYGYSRTPAEAYTAAIEHERTNARAAVAEVGRIDTKLRDLEKKRSKL